MIWLNSISDLQFYTGSKLVPCYCAILYFANDLTLQGSFERGSGNYTLQVQTLTADGLTVLETSTTSFEYYFALNPITQQHFFNARLKAFTTVMCANACYILRVTVTDNNSGGVAFDKYTERYCQASCCDFARDISFEQATVLFRRTIQTLADQPNFLDETAIDTTLGPSGKTTECGTPLITLRTSYSCYDLDGNFYQIPTTVFSGSATWSYEKITNMRGRVSKRPRSIERTYSYNCRLQRVESQRIYLFEGYEYFPAWAADEIETQLASDHIFVDNIRYEFDSGVPFSMASECKDVFRLKTQLSDCTQRLVFGCNPECAPTNFDGAQKMFVLPDSYEGGYFFDENKALVAQNYTELLDYFRGLDGVYQVSEIATSPLSCETFGAFSVFSYGYVPTSFYFDSPIARQRVFGVQLDSADEICPTFGTTCAAPVVLFTWVEEQVCEAPEINTYYVEADNSETIVITGFGDWINDGSSGGTVEEGIATITIGVGNASYAEDPSSPAAQAAVVGDTIAMISANGRPDIPLFFDSVNSILPPGNSLNIAPSGKVTFVGLTTDSTPTEGTIIIVNLTYNIINAQQG